MGIGFVLVVVVNEKVGPDGGAAMATWISAPNVTHSILSSLGKRCAMFYWEFIHSEPKWWTNWLHCHLQGTVPAGTMRQFLWLDEPTLFFYYRTCDLLINYRLCDSAWLQKTLCSCIRPQKHFLFFTNLLSAVLFVLKWLIPPPHMHDNNCTDGFKW